MTKVVRRIILLLGLAGLISVGLVGSAAAMADRDASLAYVTDAKDYIAKGKVDEAIVQLKNALQADPNNIDARLQLADLYLQTRNGVSAEKEIKAAIDRGHLKGTVQDKLAAAYLLQGKYQDIIDDLSPESAAPATLPALLCARGEAYFTLGKSGAAIAAYQAAEKVAPDDPLPKVGLARVYIHNHDITSARAMADAALMADPKSYDAMLVNAQVLQAEGDLDGAVAAFDTALAAKSDDIMGLLARAIALIDLRRYDMALKDVAAVRRLDPGHPTAAYLNALILARTGNFSAARDVLQQADAVLANYPPAIYLSGAVAFAQGSYEQASADLKRYLADQPDSPSAARLLGAALLRTGDPDSAVALLEPIVTRQPNDERIRAILGGAYMAKKQYAAAIDQFRQAIALAPDNGSLRTRLLIGELAVGDDNAAYQALGPALAQDPKAVQAAELLAQNELRAKHYSLVLDVGHALIAKYPKNPLGESIVAAALWGKGDRQSARDHYARALRIDPAYESATLSLARMDVEEHDYAAARQRYQTLLDRDPNHVSALMGLYWLSYAENDKEAQDRWLTRAIDTNPTAVEPQLELIRRHAAAGDLDRAQLEANALVRNHPQNADALRMLTEIQLKARDPIAAITTAAQLVDVAPSAPRNYLLKARAEIAVSNIDDGRATLMHGLEISPYDESLSAELVRLDIQTGNTAAALDRAKDFRAHDSGASGDELAGDAYRAMSRFEDAIAAYKAAYAKESSAELALRLNATYAAKGDPAMGVAALRTWLNVHPEDYNTRLVLAEAELKQGDLAAAAKSFETLYAEKKADPIVLNNLAWIYHQKGDSRALEMARKAYAADKNSAQIIDTLGWITLSTESQLDGLDYLRMAAALSPNTPQIRYHLAVALARTGHTDEAKTVLSDLLAGDADFPERAQAKQLEARLGN